MSKITVIEDDVKFVVSGEVECHSCNGTGIYQGMAERDGAAVVCSTCNGSGAITIRETFKKFFERKQKRGVERVYLTSGGYGILAKDYVDPKTGKITRFSESGVAYRDWLKGAKPKPIEDLHCPYLHTNQNMQNSAHKAHKLYLEKCDSNLTGSCGISDCPSFATKRNCWKRYHELVKD